MPQGISSRNLLRFSVVVCLKSANNLKKNQLKKQFGRGLLSCLVFTAVTDEELLQRYCCCTSKMTGVVKK